MGKITINQDSLKSRREWKRHKIQDGSNVFRILPPFGEVETHNNYPYRKWSVVWLVDPKTGRRRPFASPMTDGAKDCPVKEYNDALTKFLEKAKATLEAKGASKDKIQARLKDLREVQWNLKVQHLYAYNACSQSGEVGLLELKSTAHQSMKKMMHRYIKDYNQDPTSLGSDIKEDSGVWFNISKEGKGKETEYDVEFHTVPKNVDGEIIRVPDRSPLAENVVQNYEELGYDLNSIYLRKSYDELREILLWNLALVAEETPEAVLPGYDISGIDVTAAPSDDDEDSSGDDLSLDAAVEDEPAPATTKKKVALQLDDDDDMSDEAPAVSRAVAAKASNAAPAPSTKRAAPVAAASDDIEDLARSILGD